MMVEQCMNCRYFDRQSEKKGRCLRNPPVPYPIVEASGGVVGGQPRINVPLILSFNPIVNEDDYCGEFTQEM